MEKRALIAIILAMAILMGYQYMMVKKTPPPAPVPVTQNNAQANVQDKKDIVPPVVSEHKPKEITKKPMVNSEDITVETDNYKIVFNTLSAHVKSWTLKKYCSEHIVKGKPEQQKIQIEFLPSEIEKKCLILTGAIDDGVLIYTPSAKNVAFDNNGKAVLEFTAAGKNKLRIKKIYTFSQKDYLITLKIIVENSGRETVALKNFGLQWVSGILPFHKKQDTAFYHQTLVGDKIIRVDYKQFEKNNEQKGDIRWTALSGGGCFTAALISPNAFASASTIAYEKDHAVMDLYIPDAIIKPESVFSYEFWIYAGPTPYDTLSGYKVGLEKILHFGWFSSIGVLLLITLNFFYKLVGNYGVAIILLTILIKIVLWWPTKKSYVSMKRMQKLQPQLEALKNRFKNNPQQLNQEMLKLYREQKVNPLGGCLPMLLQLPIFYALFLVLSNAAELQGAPFIFWLNDLSKMDRFYILPALMGISMFIQQKMTPTAGVDPTQAKIFLFLPLIFVVLFASLPSGLLLYWVVQNILQILQQVYINKTTVA